MYCRLLTGTALTNGVGQGLLPPVKPCQKKKCPVKTWVLRQGVGGIETVTLCFHGNRQKFLVTDDRTCQETLRCGRHFSVVLCRQHLPSCLEQILKLMALIFSVILRS